MKKIFLLITLLNNIYSFGENLNFHFSKKPKLEISYTNKKEKFSYKKEDKNFTFKNKNFILGNITNYGIIKLANYEKILCENKELFTPPKIESSFTSKNIGAYLKLNNFSLYNLRNKDKIEFGFAYSTSREKKLYIDLALINSTKTSKDKYTKYYFPKTYIKLKNSSKLLFLIGYDFKNTTIQSMIFYSESNLKQRGAVWITNLNYKDITFNFNLLISLYTKNYILDTNKTSKNIFTSSSSLNISPIENLNIFSLIEFNIPKFDKIFYNYPYNFGITNKIDYKNKNITILCKNNYKIEKTSNGKFNSENNFTINLKNSLKINKTTKYNLEINSKTISKNTNFKNSTFLISQSFKIKKVNFDISYQYDSLNIHKIGYRLLIPFPKIKISVKNSLLIKKDSHSSDTTLTVII